MKLPLPDYGKPIKVGDLSFIYRGVYHPILWNGEDPYRPRVETLVVNPTGTSIFLRRYEPSPDHKYNYRIPGGSLDNDSDKLTQAKNETNEEALLDISNITYTNIQYFEQYPEGFLLKNGDIPIMYKGTFNDVYIAKYRRKFDKSKIDEHDLDDDMANNGKFYKILDVYKDLRPEHVDALLTSPFVSDLVKRYIRLSETKQVNVFKSNIPSSNKFVGIHEMVDIHSLTPVPKNVKLFHGSPTQDIKELKAFHDDRLYPEFGPVVFVSPYKQFAACYGTRWDDTTMKQYVTNTNDGVNVRISLLDDVQDWNHPCSLYELENDGSLYYLPGHPCEVIGKGPFKVKREERFKTFWDIVKEYNVSVQDQRTGQPLSVMINSEDHMDPKLLSERKVLREGGFYDKDGIWNSIVKIDGELYRGRVETLVFRDGSLYIQLVNKKENDNGTKYRIPGGSLERGVPNQEQAHAECMEEARLLIKNCKFSGVTYNEITGMPKWAKAIDPPVEWVGKHTEVYYAEFDKLYTGYIKKKDREEAMLRDGKFLPIEDVYNILIPEHQKVVDMYIGGKYGSISQESKDFDESYVLESSKYPDEIPQDIIDLLKELNSYDYGYVKDGKKIKGTKDFFENYKSLTISEFEKYKIGVCWDYVHYEANWFNKHGYKYETFYIQVQDEDNDCPSHTYLVFYLSNSSKVYYFESSWGKYQGIEVFDNINQLHDMIKDRHISEAKSKCDPKSYFRTKYNAKSTSWEHLSCLDYMIKVSKGRIKIEESSNESYYRITYDGIGIYEALRNNITMEEWRTILNSDKINWLPKPPNYGFENRSYFTKMGYNTFMKKTLPLIKQYLDPKKIEIDKCSLSGNIVYQDKYQVVVNISVGESYVSEACKDLITARKLCNDVRRLAKKYDANFFFVTDGASAYSNGNGEYNPAAKEMRNHMDEWEKKNGFNPDDDWSHNINDTSNYKLKKSGITENLIFNNKDLEINLDKFKAGKSNVLLITGFSGSGKSTLAKSLASKYRCVHYELDCLDFYLGGRLTREEAIGHEDGLVAFIDSKKISTNKNVTTKEEISLYKEYIKFLINWCKKHKDKKFIIEGLQIYEVYGDGDSYITSCPMIIKGTSGLVSAIRAVKRNDGSFTKEFGPLIKWVLKDDKALNKLKKDINESYVSESFDSKAYNDYMMNGTSDYLERSYKSMKYTFIPIIGLPAFINVDDLEDTVDEIGRDVLDKYWKHNKGTKANVYQPFKCYNTLHLKNDDLMNYIYNDANPLERLKIKLYHYNFSRQGRRYSILLITVKNQLKSIYFITNTGELQPIDSAIRESSMYHGESSVQGKIVNENSNATEKKVLNFVYKDNIKFLDKFDRNKDFIIKKGYYANRVSDTNKEITNTHKRVYVTLSKLDHLLYIDSIQDDGLHIRYTEYAPDGYSIRYIINKDLKFPSYHTLIETFIDTVNHYGIEYIASKMDSSSYSKIDFIKEFNSIYYNELNRNSCYCRFIGQIADDTQYSQYFIDALIDKGYSAIIDENDYEFGKGFTKSPIIILDRTSYLRKVSDTVITREILDYASSVTIADMKNAEKTISFGDRIIDCSKEYKALFGDGDKYVLEGVTDFEVSSKDGTGYIVVESGKNSQYHKCTKCGSTNIGVFIQGEPIYKCKECGQYLGTVPFRSEGEDIVSEGFIARILGREDNTSVLIKRHKNPEWFTFLNTCDNIEELIVFRNNANKMIPGIAIIGQRIIACKKKGECKETESYYKSIKKKYIDAGITEKDCTATIRWIEGFIKSMSTKISKLCKERERSLKEGTNLSFVQEDGDIVTEGVINQLVMSAPVKAYNIKNKTPINDMSDLIKYHKNPGLINYVNKCDDIEDLKYIKEDTNTITPSVKIIKERITLCKQMGDCDKTASYYKYIKRKYIDVGITERDCDATIQWVKDFNKVINIKVGKLGKDVMK